MNSTKLEELLREHQTNLSDIRISALKFIKKTSDDIDNEEVISNHSHENNSKEKLVNQFLKISGMLMRLIPLEYQIIGTKLCKNKEIESLRDKETDELDVSEEDISILKEFLKKNV
ncbi:MAG: NACalpha-BTF3-like transcription factor [Candidatus Midichloriaceae bacterium]|jgi:NACalpha-BTF3-like transcription factor